jgi:AcrR family transcriptional regulator
LTEQAAAKKSVKATSKAPQADTLLAAACAIVATEGLAGLTLRPLAAALGVSVTVLSTRYGARVDVIAAICDAAAAHDASILAAWRARLVSLETLPPTIAADLAETILEELVTRERAVSMLYLEVLHACTWDETLRPAFAPWAEVRRGFWNGFAMRAGLAPALHDWWHGCTITELAYGIVLDPVPSYRMLRRLCLRRLFAGGTAQVPPTGDAALFALLLTEMRHADVAVEASPAPAWLALAARACAIRLAAQGVGALTHRAIAAEVGIAHTTLSYRFPTQNDLVVAGLEYIVAHILSAVDADSLDELQRRRLDGDGPRLDLARASFAVALAAARMPALAPYVASLRSRRGGNLVKVFGKYLPATPGIDALCAQVVSLGLTGLTITQPPGAASEQAVAAAFSAAAKWLARQA